MKYQNKCCQRKQIGLALMLNQGEGTKVKAQITSFPIKIRCRYFMYLAGDCRKSKHRAVALVGAAPGKRCSLRTVTQTEVCYAIVVQPARPRAWFGILIEVLSAEVKNSNR